MDPNSLNVIKGAAGAGGVVGDPVYVEEVFSTYVYEGTGATNPIDNGIDLDGEGGMVWIKSRTNPGTGYYHHAVDSERAEIGGFRPALFVNDTAVQNEYPAATYGGVSSLNSDGFTLSSGSSANDFLNANNYDYVSWSFRKAPGFFDVVEWTGNSTAGREIPHSLGSVPGMIVVKCTTHTENWVVWHRSILNTQALWLQSTDDVYDQSEGPINIWNSTTPTSTAFTVGDSDGTNGDSSHSYVAYVFAHDDQQFGDDQDESIIKCGTYAGNTLADGPEIDLGWEPQWVMVKRATGSPGLWLMVDNMRGITTGGDDPYLQANDYTADVDYSWIDLTSTGFKLTNNGQSLNYAEDYLYIAIRRGPMKTPTDATKVFNIVADPGSGSSRVITAGNLIDLQISKARDNDTGTNKWYWIDRVRGSTSFVNSASTDDEMGSQIAATRFDLMDGMSVAATDGWSNASPWGGPFIRYFLTRAPGFFDVVAYTGNGSTNNISHNLQAIPELMIFKNRDATIGWPVWFGDGSNICRLDLDNGKFDEGLDLDATSATNIPISSANSSYNDDTVKYIVYLFATLSGISKVGIETVGSAAIDVNCDFTGGARFVMIKRTDDVGDWYVYDSTRGIASGNDDFLVFNELDVENSNDYIDPLTTGFTINTSLPAGDYIYLAIA